ncbi:MAG: cobalt ABC transporter ATP-binding protein [Coriobacteriia bacterium]|nr:MAG: cobalt ABC transporter ATP-binding protein [Coriobacteriia bacterium]
MALFALEHLSFGYPDATAPALDDLNLEVERGEYLCVCGKSGCGKTTLLRQLKSVLAPFGQRSGTILLDGVSLDEVPLETQARRIGFVMQDPDAQIVTDKVWHELAFGLESIGCPSPVLRLRVAEMASYFGISDWFDRDVSELSGGQKQLLNLAGVMAMQPDVLVCDEPTSQLDPIATASFLDTLRRLNRELGVTVIISEHRLEDVFAQADRALVLDEGHMAAYGTPREVAARLYATGDDMTRALPSPVRVFYGVQGMPGGATAGTGDGAPPCPLTVREGRTWLVERVLAKPPGRVNIPDDTDDMDARKPVVELRDLWFRYERQAPDVLRGLDLRVPQAALFALVGSNGSGKSTLLRCLCGVQRPYRGKMRVLGRKRKSSKGAERLQEGVAMLPQDPANLFSKNSVHEELAEMLADQGLDASENARRCAAMAHDCGIERILDAHPRDLSGGEQQRVALAKVLLTEPRLLLLDEPTKGIDAFFKHELAILLHHLTERDVSIIMVSHDIEFCARYADFVGLLFDGSVVTTATPRRLFSDSGFYTTAANRMSRSVFAGAITDEDVIELCLS